MDHDPDEADWSPDPATVLCPECDAEVIEDADRCPDCGHYFSTDAARGKKARWYRIVIAFIVGLLIWRIIRW
jgi:predicted amidophosphoribosyltransferase